MGNEYLLGFSTSAGVVQNFPCPSAQLADAIAAFLCTHEEQIKILLASSNTIQMSQGGSWVFVSLVHLVQFNMSV